VRAIFFLDPAGFPPGPFQSTDDLAAAARHLGSPAVCAAELGAVLRGGGDGDLLVMGHGERYPEDLAAPLRDFLGRGGDLL